MLGMSTLKHLYSVEGHALLDKLHLATGLNRKYLYQMATDRRRPSAVAAAKLIKADSRLSLEGLLFGIDDLHVRDEINAA